MNYATDYVIVGIRGVGLCWLSKPGRAGAEQRLLGGTGAGLTVSLLLQPLAHYCPLAGTLTQENEGKKH